MMEVAGCDAEHDCDAIAFGIHAVLLAEARG
jgi:hypothetical protein